MVCGCAAPAVAAEQAREAHRTPAAPPRRSNPISRSGNQANLRRLQAKLTIGAVNDPLEQEADAAAERVMRMADPSISHTAPPTLSRKCAECEEDEEKKSSLQRQATSGGLEGTLAPPVVDAVLSSPGRPLAPATQSFMGDRFGADFSEVRIHTDAKAAESAAAVRARAYTVGRDVVFGAGQYDPAGAGGRQLLAHELAHTLQQSSKPPASSSKSRRSVQRACGEKQVGALEVDATGLLKQLGDVKVNGPPIHFRVGCDEFLTPEELQALKGMVERLGPRARIVIHGFASEEGPAEFNEMLSIARAIKVRDIVSGLINGARIERTVWHGAVPGNRPDRRSVVLEVTGAAPSQHRTLSIVSWINGEGLPDPNPVSIVLFAPGDSREAIGACKALKCTSNTRPPDTLPESDWQAFIGSKQYRAFQTFKIEHYPASDLADSIGTAQHVGYTAPSTCAFIPPDDFVQGEPSPLNHVDTTWTPKDTTIDSLMKIRVSTEEETAAVDKATSWGKWLVISRSRITHVPWVWSQTKVKVDGRTGALNWSVHASRFPTNTVYLDGKKVGELPQGGCNVVINQRFRNIREPRQSLEEEKKQGSVSVERQDETVSDSATAFGGD